MFSLRSSLNFTLQWQFVCFVTNELYRYETVCIFDLTKDFGLIFQCFIFKLMA